MKNEHTYELWFLGDMVGEPQPKNHATFEALLNQAHYCFADAVLEFQGFGDAEIVHRWGEHGQHDEIAWSMSLNEFKKANGRTTDV